MGEQVERAEAGDERCGDEHDPGRAGHREHVPRVGDDLARGVELRHAVDLLGVGQRLQEEVVPDEQHDDGQRAEQEVPPGADVGVAVLAVAREEQVQAVGHAGSEGDGVAEGVLRIEVEGQTLGRDDADDEQHADDHGGDAQDALDVELFLQEDRCQDG